MHVFCAGVDVPEQLGALNVLPALDDRIDVPVAEDDGGGRQGERPPDRDRIGSRKRDEAAPDRVDRRAVRCLDVDPVVERDRIVERDVDPAPQRSRIAERSPDRMLAMERLHRPLVRERARRRKERQARHNDGREPQTQRVGRVEGPF
jgi:hypothetical protein